ncbi:MAG: hypothetical protein ABJA79_00590 [Parafilimonas sp.]
MSNGIFYEIEQQLTSKGLRISNKDISRPWGGFFVLDETQAEKFIQLYFPQLSLQEVSITNKLSPKILIVAPHKRLSWQYHFRRAELWRVVKGPVAVAKNDTDEQKDMHVYKDGEFITLKQGERHRLIGLNDYGIVAEIWQHTDADNPSDEDDIVRLQDDFGR